MHQNVTNFVNSNNSDHEVLTNSTGRLEISKLLHPSPKNFAPWHSEDVLLARDVQK